MRHSEFHRAHRIGWLRAAVLGANDGIVSTASLLVGVAFAGADHHTIFMTGLAGLVSGAMSMAAGEYVSVSSQADTENADLARERAELAANPDSELVELTRIYIDRGLSPGLAEQVALELTAHDALSAHAREELGIHEMTSARPILAALASAGTFAAGAALPLIVAWLAPHMQAAIYVASTALILLAGLGGLAATTGGAHFWRGAGRVCFWGALAMGATALVGRFFGVTIA